MLVEYLMLYTAKFRRWARYDIIPIDISFMKQYPGSSVLVMNYVKSTWWLIPLSKWVITPVISGLTLLIPLITGVITHLRFVGWTTKYVCWLNPHSRWEKKIQSSAGNISAFLVATTPNCCVFFVHFSIPHIPHNNLGFWTNTNCLFTTTLSHTQPMMAKTHNV